MKNRVLSTRFCAVLLLIAVLWRIVGAPLTLRDFENMQTPLRQARLLLPQRVERMLKQWVGTFKDETAQTMTQETGEISPDAETVLVYLGQENRLVQMPLEGYVCGVAAAEMPAQYHLEAIKAQMVAARTRALWQKEQGGCANHPGADICTESTHCQGYASLGECQERWGAEYEAYRDRLLQAQKETAGQWIAYQNKPITVLYHAISGGRTENAQTVFANQLPYLVSVESSGEEQVRGYQQETFLAFDEMADRLSSVGNILTSAEEIQRTFSVADYTESGRVKNVRIGSAIMEATELRRILGLRSTWFSITANSEGITFHQRGWGHGVGMSQAGANSMAAAGADYEQILKHYYTGVNIVN